MAYFNFNAEQISTPEYIENPGDYVAKIVDTDVTPPNANGTQFLVLTWETDKRARITSRYTVCCPNNKTAENIGLAFLKRLAQGVFGIQTFTETNTLLDREWHMIHVDKRPRKMQDGTTKEYCEVTKVEKIANQQHPSYDAHQIPDYMKITGEEPFSGRPDWAK